MTVAELAARTPATRDRYVDFLRAVSILAVVVGHWLIGIIWWHDGIIRTTSAVGVTPWLWLGTWVFQVMPVFFFVGGFSNLVAYDSFMRRGQTTGEFIRSRVERLMRPSLIFLAIWLIIQVFLHVADIGGAAGPRLWGDTSLLRGMKPPGATVPFGPLWFLAVYLVVVVISPVTIRLHRRFGLWVPALMVAMVVVVDLVGFGLQIHRVRYLNIAPVLLLPHQLGHFYGDKSMLGWPRRALWGMVGSGLLGLILLTNPPIFRVLIGPARFDWFPGIGHYPKSLLGTEVEAISNAYPPTMCFMLVGIWTIGAVMLLRQRLSLWLERSRPWSFTVGVNGVIMTFFLWHMTAFLIAVLLLWPLGLGQETDSTGLWWLERFVWVGIPGVILLGLTAIFGKYERPRPRKESLPAPPITTE